MKYLIAALLISAGAAHADQYTDVMTKYANDSVFAWGQDPALLAAIQAQNARHAALGQAQIDELDRQWRAEVGTASRPTIDPVMTHPVSDYLRGVVADSAGIVTEVFVMDNKGLNVAASDVTSDYWQGDEAKFTDSFGVGAGAIHIGDIEFDESTQTYQGQVSVAITDPGTGAVIGAMTVGLNAEMLF